MQGLRNLGDRSTARRMAQLVLAGVGRDEAQSMLTDDQLGDDPFAAVVEWSRHQAEPFGAYGDGPSGTLPPEASQLTRLLDWFGRRR